MASAARHRFGSEFRLQAAFMVRRQGPPKGGTPNGPKRRGAALCRRSPEFWPSRTALLASMQLNTCKVSRLARSIPGRIREPEA